MDFYASICRLCEAAPKMTDKWSDLYAAKNKQLIEKIQSICKVKINNRDKLPKRICDRCRNNLMQAYNFKLKCELTDAKLRKEIEFLKKNNWKTEEALPPYHCERQVKPEKIVNTKQTEEAETLSESIASVIVVEPVFIKSEQNEEFSESEQLDETMSDLCSTKVEPQEENDSKDDVSSESDDDSNDADYSEGDGGSDVKPPGKKALRSDRKSKTDNTEPSNTTCETCGEQFEKSSQLYAHNKAVHGKRRFCCKICSRSFSRRVRLADHELRHTGVRQFECPHCDKSYVTQSGLKTHVEDAHSENLPYVCDKCGKGFSKPGKLRVHYSMHIESRNFVCAVCSKGYKTQTHLNIHMNVHLPQDQKKVRSRRSREKVCICPFCGKVSTSLGTHSMHIRTHTGDQRYECNICFKRFTSSGSHKKHLRVHSGEKPFVCVYCSKSFRQKHHMTTHIRGVHTNEKPYQCKFCPKAFATRGNMTLHERSHGGPTAAVASALVVSESAATVCQQLKNVPADEGTSEPDLERSPSHSSSMMTSTPPPMLNPGVMFAPGITVHQPQTFFQV
ncbi:zinc finger protein 391-like [Wyeomyia smithii]|uniref:zinc finger protein 391-like n=1 Tax=Wyeomyia smithii TaxID=174621 RepID=UPI002467F031|nr:zinc finger protein 391-like [Wyeomyia smithii]